MIKFEVWLNFLFKINGVSVEQNKALKRRRHSHTCSPTSKTSQRLMPGLLSTSGGSGDLTVTRIEL